MNTRIPTRVRAHRRTPAHIRVHAYTYTRNHARLPTLYTHTYTVYTPFTNAYRMLFFVSCPIRHGAWLARCSWYLAQRREELLGLGQWRRSPQGYLYGKVWRHQEGFQAILRRIDQGEAGLRNYVMMVAVIKCCSNQPYKRKYLSETERRRAESHSMMNYD